MAEQKAKPKKPIFGNKAKKKLDISVQSVIDHMVFSKKDVWAFYRVKPQMFDFISADTQVERAISMSTAFTALLENRKDPLELHLSLIHI